MSDEKVPSARKTARRRNEKLAAEEEAFEELFTRCEICGRSRRSEREMCPHCGYRRGH